MSFNILNIGEHVLMDDSITNYEMHSHPPYANTTFNNSDEIRIPIQTQDIYTLPSQSYLYIEGRLTDAENKPSITLNFVNNGMAFLFDEIRYEIGGTVVDRVRNPGITSSIKGYISYTSSECDRYNNACWNHLEYPKVSDSNGYFNVYIPLKHLLGFCEDFKKIIVNIRQELVLIRTSSDVNSVISTKDNEKPKVNLTKILWRIPHVQVSDTEKLRLLKYIEKGRDLEIAFRSWELHEYPLLQQTMTHSWNVKASNQLEKPRFIIVAFQTQRKNQIKKNISHFDHCNITNIKLHLNSDVYPYDNMNLNFKKNQFALLYELFAQFQESYYYKTSGEPCLTLTKFHDIAPLFVIDCSRQNDSLKVGVQDIRLDFEASENIPANTSAFCLILHDRLLRYNPLTNSVKQF
ncbi:uncharacterized protein isoform X1 [Leptinotarsa decemlineata]|uniref:uncharacterized protein isoform X1 n=1 Tax=Leptinotarsa decemlineata TaxID=7539 RepID=UPI003D30C7D4